MAIKEVKLQITHNSRILSMLELIKEIQFEEVEPTKEDKAVVPTKQRTISSLLIEGLAEVTWILAAEEV
jgi:hypothetical protein